MVVVNRTLADRFWGSAGGAIGRRIRIGDEEPRTVVGVADDVKYLTINESPRPYFYLPFLQAYRPDMAVHVRVHGSVDAAAKRARELVAALDPNLPVEYARPLGERLKGATIFYRLAAAMLSLFGIAGMVLAAMGTYGLVAYTVKQHTHEIGIRIALGASGASIVREFLAHGLRLGILGVFIGISGALAGGDLIRSALFGVSATDAASFARALVVVLGGVAIATLAPAWRAARTSPLSALRHQ